MEQLVPNFQMMTPSPHLRLRAGVALLYRSLPRLTLQVRKWKQKQDLVFPPAAGHTPSAGHLKAAHIWLHRDGIMQKKKIIVCWIPEVEQPIQPEIPAVSEKT